MLVDDKAAEGGTSALGPLRTRTTTFTRPDVGIGVVPMTSTTVVEGLACGTDIAIVFGLVGETLGTEERAVFSMDTVTGPRVGSDAAVG